eukprot:13065570-Ditylum_brightwellii.AAC.1
MYIHPAPPLSWHPGRKFLLNITIKLNIDSSTTGSFGSYTNQPMSGWLLKYTHMRYKTSRCPAVGFA